MKFIIEHLDKKVYEWSFLEYRHISEILGRDNRDNLIFTNVKGKKDRAKLKGLGEVLELSAAEFIGKNSIPLANVCVLDILAGKTLISEERFDFKYLIFGGILGDHPPQKRTKAWLSDKIGCEKRNLGSEQMSTDTAVLVAKKIADGKRLSEIEFKDNIVIKTGKNEEVELPFRYAVENKKAVLPEGLVELLKKGKEF